MNPPIYLLTTCLNSVATIDKTLWGVFSQEGGISIRYHVQDGGSTDGTLEKLVSWEKRLSTMRAHLPCEIEFSYDSRRDGGMYEGIRTGFDQMRVPENALMGWCNADDVIWQGTLAHINHVGREFPEVQWLSGWSTAFDELGRLKWMQQGTFFPQQILAAGMANGTHWPHLQQESTFWRKRLWDRVGGVDTSFKLAGDWDLWRRFAQHEELVHVDRQLGAFYFRKDQKSSNAATYSGECIAAYPMAARVADYRRILASKPKLGVTRITNDENGNLIQVRDEVDPILGEKIRFNLLPLSTYFRNLKRRHYALRRRHERRTRRDS